MKIWKLDFKVDEYENFMPIKNFTYEEIRAFDGRKHLEKWKPLPVERMEPEKKLQLGDAPGFTIPVFSKRALEILRPLIQSDIEALELEFSEGEFWGINVTTVLNVIDYAKSEYKMYSDGKRIMVFEKYVFRYCSELENHNIFKIIDEPARKAFVSDKFKQTVEGNNLEGFDFELVWDSENE